ncbi:MAG: FaeA/PapI family transcriptional regulator, partial [Bacteroidota bacterium]
LSQYIQGLIEFRKTFTGEIWLEVLILPGYNDHHEELMALKQAIEQIQPDKIQLNTLDRPGVEDNLTSASVQHLRRIQKAWNLENVEIIAKPKQRKSIASYGKDTESAILETIKRRPCTAEDLSAVLGLHINEVNKYLDVLEAEKKIHHIKQGRGIFYRNK